MHLAELLEIVRNGENSGIEFKRDDVAPEKLAKEIAAFANFRGGRVLLGVEDDGTVSGLVRTAREAEEWVMNVCRESVDPELIPFWETVSVPDTTGGHRTVAVVTVPQDAPQRPYRVRRHTYIRVGTTSREASRDEEQRMFQSSGTFRYELKPALGATINDLDLDVLDDYFARVRRNVAPARTDLAAWEHLLVTLELCVRDANRVIPTVGAVLLFGRTPHRFVRQSGIRALAFGGPEKDYAALGDLEMRAAIVGRTDETGRPRAGYGLIESAMDFVRRFTMTESTIDAGGQRLDYFSYPLEAVREAIVNAVAHRDYTIANAEIELAIFSDHLDVQSPGRLPDGVTTEGLRLGLRAARNELVRDVLRDYHYLEYMGLGVPRKIIPLLREQNGTEPEFVEQHERFTVRLWKRGAGPSVVAP